MLCAISGEAPKEPVISTKSGNVFEKRLIEAYITENGKDPITGEELTLNDLLEVKSPRVVRPRPPTLTSIPSLLTVFQNEWDALALETFTLQQQLTQTRQELSTALYQHDAAVRVIARLIKERDEARDALARLSISGGAPQADGDAMQVDAEVGLSEEVKTVIEETHAKLSAGRKKRAIPEGWVNADAISEFKEVESSESLYPGTKFISVDGSGELALVGGADGVSGIYSVPNNEVITPLKAEDGAITDGLWRGKQPVTASENGVIRVWSEDGSENTALRSHAGAVVALALHPSGDILASVGVDKTWILHDLKTNKVVAQVRSDEDFSSAAFHPDGHLFAAGTTAGNIVIYDTKSLSIAATFPHNPALPVTSLAFNENGFLLATTLRDDSSVYIWNLRKGALQTSVDTGSRVDDAAWDWSGQFLAATGNNGVVVQFYDKKTKGFAELLRRGTQGVAVGWADGASKLLVAAQDGVVRVLGSEA
ncbi:cell cycle control protein cwf8 [Ascobolus immersus RN42]|uniref:Pre-mRNA-processing factor 19 n=1 Tax=Ascobolus immersus RN42 TaxID=1160509 RepID=A0A3N4IG90_ASCIM|nr:cell cycle control protein cwf8 [Ascobolus immersus RN42]